MAHKSIDPYTNIVVHESMELTDNELNQVIDKAYKCKDQWRNTSFGRRKELMLKVAQGLKDNKEELAQVITNEMGKVITESRKEIEKCAWVCEHYAQDAEVLLKQEAVATEAHHSYVTYEPMGVILGIMPWNFPFWQVFRFVAPTIMAGNVVLLKHASNAQKSAEKIIALFNDAGFPDDVILNVNIKSKDVHKVIDHAYVDAITLTGSEAAGSDVASLAGKNIKKTVLELGGSNAFIVLPDADLMKAVDEAVNSRMQNAGQSCIASKRFILHKDISSEFIDLFLEKINGLIVGDPTKENTQVGPLANEGQVEKLDKQIKDSVGKGAKVIHGKPPKGNVFPPTVVANVGPGMPLFDEETFGPVAPLIIAHDTEEAIELSNNSRFGLGVTLFTNDIENAEKLVPRFNEGAVFINSMVKSDPRLPFGGVKKSGYGRELASNGILEFVNVKTIYVDKIQGTKPEEDENLVISTGKSTV